MLMAERIKFKSDITSLFLVLNNYCFSYFIHCTGTCELGNEIFNYFLDLFSQEICGRTQNKILGRAMPSYLLTSFVKFRVFCAIDFTIFNSSSLPLLAFVLLFLITIHHGQVFYPAHSGKL